MTSLPFSLQGWPVSPRRHSSDARQQTGRAPRQWWPAFRAWLREAWRRHRARTYLSEMNAHMLKDIGVTAAEAKSEREANKPFWRA